MAVVITLLVGGPVDRGDLLIVIYRTLTHRTPSANNIRFSPHTTLGYRIQFSQFKTPKKFKNLTA